VDCSGLGLAAFMRACDGRASIGIRRSVNTDLLARYVLASPAISAPAHFSIVAAGRCSHFHPSIHVLMHAYVDRPDGAHASIERPMAGTDT